MADAPALTPYRLGGAPYVLIEIQPTPGGGEGLTLQLRTGGGIDTPAKIVATVLALVEQITGASCDEYAEQAGRALRDRDKEVRPE